MKLYKEDAPFIVTLVVIIVVVFAPLVGYVLNVVDVLTKPQHQTATIPNVICGIGVIPTAPTFFIGGACGLIRD